MRVGSHTVLALLAEGYEVVIVDNLSNSSIRCLDKMKELAEGKSSKITFYEVKGGFTDELLGGPDECWRCRHSLQLYHAG